MTPEAAFLDKCKTLFALDEASGTWYANTQAKKPAIGELFFCSSTKGVLEKNKLRPENITGISVGCLTTSRERCLALGAIDLLGSRESHRHVRSTTRLLTFDSERPRNASGAKRRII